MVASDVWKRLFPATSGGGGGGKRRLSSSLVLLNSSSSSRRRSSMDLVLQQQMLNPLRLCSGLKVLGYFMILLVAAIVGLSYYAVVVVTWVPHLLDGGFSSFTAFLVLILFHYLLVLLIWSYIMVVVKDPGSVPLNWNSVAVAQRNMEEGNATAVPDGLHPQNSVPLVGVEIGPSVPVRHCSHCQNDKPPRCHHCSICQRCVLKMDHHCIWVVNCVGARNYKFFLLFVFYTFLETILNTLALLPSFINFFEQAKQHSLSPGDLAVTFLAFGKCTLSIISNFECSFAYFSLSFSHGSVAPSLLQMLYLDAVLNLAFALSLLCFVVMHTNLLLSNTTSVEVHEKKRNTQWKYDVGRKRNFEQVFGTKKVLWFFPLYSDEDLKNIPALHGLEFPICSDMGE